MTHYAYPDHDLHGEPSLEEILSEPIVRLIMSRDGVEERDMRGTIDRIKSAYNVPESVN